MRQFFFSFEFNGTLLRKIILANSYDEAKRIFIKFYNKLREIGNEII